MLQISRQFYLKIHADVLNIEFETEDIDNHPKSKLPPPSPIVEAWRLGNFADVVDRCESELALKPDLTLIEYLRGWAFAKLSKHSEAYETHQKLLSANEALAVMANPDYSQSYLHFSKIAMNPVLQHVESGTVHKINASDVLDAYHWLDATITLDPRGAEAYALRSLLHETQGYRESADRDWRRALACGYRTIPPKPLLLSAKERTRDWFDFKMVRSVRATVIEVDTRGVLLEDTNARRIRASVLTLSPLDQVWLLEMPRQIQPVN